MELFKKIKIRFTRLSPVFMGGNEKDFFYTQETDGWWKATFQGDRRAFWRAWEYSYDFANGPAYEERDLKVYKLPGNPRISYQLLCSKGADISKVRKRVEDYLLKGSEKELFEVATLLGISLDN